MRYQVVLDGLHFPHILDTIFDSMSIASLARASQVCQQWRIRVKSMCSQVALYTYTKELHCTPIPNFELRTGHSIAYPELEEDKNARVFLAFCQCFWTDAVVGCCPHQIMGTFDPRLFSNLRIFRTWDDQSDGCGGGIHTLHVKGVLTPLDMCACRQWLLFQEISKVVFSVNWMTWDLYFGDEAATAFPSSSKSLTIIYLLESNKRESSWHDPYWHFSDHWGSLDDLIKKAWSKGMIVTIVNARDLEDLRQDIDHLLYFDFPPQPESAVHFIRQRAIRAVVGDDDAPPPGPVCPVHFVTLDEYRAHVGEVEYAMHTDPGWIPRVPG